MNRRMTLRAAYEDYIRSRIMCKEREQFFLRSMTRYLADWMDLSITEITMDMVEQKHQELIAMPSRYNGLRQSAK